MVKLKEKRDWREDWIEVRLDQEVRVRRVGKVTRSEDERMRERKVRVSEKEKGKNTFWVDSAKDEPPASDLPPSVLQISLTCESSCRGPILDPRTSSRFSSRMTILSGGTVHHDRARRMAINTQLSQPKHQRIRSMQPTDK